MREYFKQGLREIFVRPASHAAPVDGLRAIAILYVLLFHCFFFLQYSFAGKQAYVDWISRFPVWLGWVWQGDKGVDIFFVISGFLIGSILLRDQLTRQAMDLRRFYVHRLARILPLYFFAVFLYGITSKKNTEYFWANLLFVNNFLPAEKLFIPWSWSLTIEVQFYLVIPFVLMALLKLQRPLAGLIALVLGAMLLRAGLTASEPVLYERTFADYFLLKDRAGAVRYAEVLYMNLYTRMGPLLMGVILGYLHVYHAERVRDWLARHRHLGHGLLLGIVALGVYVLLYPDAYIPSSDPRYRMPRYFLYVAMGNNLFGLAVAAILFYALYGDGAGAWIRKILSARFWYPIAQTSYSIYLFHIPFVFVAFLLVYGRGKLAAVSVWQVFATAGVGLGLAFVFGIVTYLLIERPAIRYARGLRKQPSAVK
jgi:peptidoglycan/LPS O-acetylase OafA/YrhL